MRPAVVERKNFNRPLRYPNRTGTIKGIKTKGLKEVINSHRLTTAYLP